MDLVEHVIREHINLIGIHTMNAEGEGGFKSAQDLEHQTINMVAGMLGGRPGEVDGYFCQGGTESILQGMWLGREWLSNNRDVEPSPTVILTSELHHYSINKAAWILGFGYYRLKQCPRCGHSHLFERPIPVHGVNLVGVNARGEMSVTDLERQMANLYTAGVRRFLIVATAGTTVMGSIDPIEQISSMTREFAESRVIQFGERQRPLVYLHVDASFAGFTIPFLPGAPSIGFDIPGVMSVTVDADKMGRLPYPSGIFMCSRRDPAVSYTHPSEDKRRLIDHVKLEVGYIGGHCDSTVPGSRSFLPVAMAWTRWRSIGVSGQREYVQRCLQERDRLASKLSQQFGTNGTVRILPTSPYVNILPIVIVPPPGSHFDPHYGKLAPYELRSDAFFGPIDERTGGCPDQVYKIVVMPHMFGHFDRFISDLAEALDTKGSRG